MKKLIIIIAAILVIAGGLVSSYNGLVSMHEQVNSS